MTRTLVVTPDGVGQLLCVDSDSITGPRASGRTRAVIQNGRPDTVDDGRYINHGN
jgi:hypothetical protein